MSTTLHSFMDIFESTYIVGNEPVKLEKIVIPIIQRDYAQGRSDSEVKRVRERFLDALYDAVTIKPITLDFVYGDIDEEGTLTPLDGQQRLTTLFLLHWYAAKRDKIDSAEYTFLSNFSYETRYSARDFCGELVAFDPTFEDECISKEIINQPWFPLDWKKDPTISSMLVMLDAISEKFESVDRLWERLKDKAITFYFLPIKDMGLTDELYIKMNSRGKPLTLFEHFKADLEKAMVKVDEKVARRIVSKFDKEWLDLLWAYRDGHKGTADDNTVDDEFLNYFKFICDVICYEEGGSLQGKSRDEFDLIDQYFSVKCENALENMESLEASFDCWCNVDELGYSSPTDFIYDYMAQEHESGKVRVDSRYRDRIDIFEDCLHRYSESSGRQRSFPLNRFVMLYAINCYLQNTDKITEDEYRRRIRIINNLIQNSEDQIADRTDNNRMPAITQQTKNVILTGAIDKSIENSFNVNQIEEEIEKAKFLEANPGREEQLYSLEDSNMLYGQIGIVGLNHIDHVDRFHSLFDCDRDKIDCALMSVGDYSQTERVGWRYQFASSKRIIAWNELFHRSFNQGFENTSEILNRLLEMHETFDDDKLNQITEDFISQCESKKSFPWRYYYVKYPSFRPGSFGKMGKMEDEEDKAKEHYKYAVMLTRSYYSENTYIPYFMEADSYHVDRAENGLYLTYDNHYITCWNDCYEIWKISENDEDEMIETIEIKQDENDIDTEDRIVKLKQYLKEHPGL